MQNTGYYAAVLDGVYTDIFRDPRSVRFCVDPDQYHLIYEVSLREVRPGETQTHWGWVDTGSDTYEMVWPDQVQFGVCFPYGVEAEVKMGRGRIADLVLSPLKQVYPRKEPSKEG